MAISPRVDDEEDEVVEFDRETGLTDATLLLLLSLLFSLLLVVDRWLNSIAEPDDDEFAECNTGSRYPTEPINFLID